MLFSNSPHILSIDQFKKECIIRLLNDARIIEDLLNKQQSLNLLSGKIMATLFFEASTRTRFSFTSAMLRLGGQAMNFSADETRTGGNWNESLSDTARMMNGYADVVVFRHREVESLNHYVSASQIPVINAGNGWAEYGAEHPTQALIDLYTIRKELGSIENLKILLIGDMNARVIRSLMKALGQFSNITLYLFSLDEYWISHKDEEEYRNSKVQYERIYNLDAILKEVDVIYQHGLCCADPVPKPMRLTKEKLKGIKHGAIIMHPLPRAEDLATSVDCMRQAKYFGQAKNGVPVRMALLAQLFNQKI